MQIEYKNAAGKVVAVNHDIFWAEYLAGKIQPGQIVKANETELEAEEVAKIIDEADTNATIRKAIDEVLKLEDEEKKDGKLFRKKTRLYFPVFCILFIAIGAWFGDLIGFALVAFIMLFIYWHAGAKKYYGYFSNWDIIYNYRDGYDRKKKRWKR